MEHDRVLTFTPVNHPNHQVRKVGFDLSDTYVEQCWSAVVGPSAVVLLRRMPELWRHEVPAMIPADELSRSIGLGAGTGPNSRLASTTDRLVKFGLARRGGDPDRFEVYLEVAPLQARQLDRMPEWTQATHERLFSAHLEGFDGVAQHRTKVASAAVDLDRFRERAARTTSTTPAARQALGR